MKKLIVIFGTTIILINLIALLAIFRLRSSNFSYRIISYDDPRFIDGILRYTEEERQITHGFWVNLDAEMAVRVAHTFILNDRKDELRKPYYVVYDAENRVFIVIAESIGGRGSVYRIIVCQDSGGILLNSVISHAKVPLFD